MKHSLIPSLITTALLLTGCAKSDSSTIEAASLAEQNQPEQNLSPIAKESSPDLVASLTALFPAAPSVVESETTMIVATQSTLPENTCLSSSCVESASPPTTMATDFKQDSQQNGSLNGDQYVAVDQEYCEVKAGTYRIRHAASTLYSCDIQTESFSLALNEKKYLRCSASSGLAGAIKLACLNEVVPQNENSGSGYGRKQVVYDLGINVSDAKPFDWVRFSGAPDFTSGKEMIPVGDNGSRSGSYLKIDNFPCDTYFDITTSAYGGVRLLGQVTQRSPGTILSTCLKNGNDDLIIVKMRCSGKSAVNYPAGGAERIGNWEVHSGLAATLDASGESCSATSDTTISSSTLKWIPAPEPIY